MCRIIVTGYLARWDASSETLSPPSKEIVVKQCKKCKKDEKEDLSEREYLPV